MLSKSEFKIDEFTYVFDSAYYQKPDVPALKMNLQSMETLLKKYGIEMYNKVPTELTSAWDLDFHCDKCHANGPEYHNSENDIMFGRKQKTKEFILRLADILNCEYFIDVAIPEHIYIWKMDENNKFIYSKIYTTNRKLPEIEIDDVEKSAIDTIISDKHIVVQFGMRGYHETVNNANEYISWLKSQGYKVIVIGFNYGFQFDDNVIDMTNGKLSFDGYLYLLKNANKAMLYSSFFSFYRMYLGLEKKTIVYWAKHLGSWDAYLDKKCLENKNNIIIDSDVFGNSTIMEYTND